MYNRLKTLVNQVRNLGSKKWDNHEVVKVILRSLIFLNPTQVQLIRGDPRYKLMSPEEVIGKFVSFELMIKGSKKIIEQGTSSTPEAQPVAFKATEEKKEESTPSRQPIDASKLDNEEMALVIKSFRQILKQRRGKGWYFHITTSEISEIKDYLSDFAFTFVLDNSIMRIAEKPAKVNTRRQKNEKRNQYLGFSGRNAA